MKADRPHACPHCICTWNTDNHWDGWRNLDAPGATVIEAVIEAAAAPAYHSAATTDAKGHAA